MTQIKQRVAGEVMIDIVQTLEGSKGYSDIETTHVTV
jgi:hypothetical protein